MIAKFKAVYARVLVWASSTRSALTAAAGLLAQLVALGLFHGTTLDVARAVLAVLTVLGVHVATKATLRARR